MRKDGGILPLDPVPDLDRALDDDSLLNMDKGPALETGMMEGSKLLRTKANLGSHEALAEEFFVIPGSLLKWQQENPRGKPLQFRMNQLPVCENEFAR